MELRNFYEIYGEEVVCFDNCYKYVFHFSGDNVVLDIGGNHDDIYRFGCSNEPTTVKDLLDEFGLGSDYIYFSIR